MESTTEKICPNCGEKLPGDSSFCVNCGTEIDEEKENIEQPIKTQGFFKKKKENYCRSNCNCNSNISYIHYQCSTSI